MKERNLLGLFVLIILFSIVTSILSPLLSPYLRQIGLEYYEISFFFSVIPLTILLISPLIGRLSDKVGKIRIVYISLFFYVLALIIYFSKIKALLVIANIFIAATVICADFLLIAKVQDNLKKLRGTYGGIALSLKHIGMILGPLIGGYLADRFSINFTLIVVIVAAIIIALILMIVKENKHRKIKIDDFRLLRNLKKLVLVSELKKIAAVGFFVQMNNPAMGIFLPLLITEKLKLSYIKAGIAFSFIGLFFVFQFIFGALSDKIGDKKSIIIGNVLTSIALVLISRSNSYFFLLISLLIFSFSGAFWNPAAYSLMSKIGSKNKSIGEVMGFYNSIGKIGEFIGYLISGVIVSLFGISSLFLFNSSMILLGIFIFSYRRG